ncbi:MAG TPA: M1 family metallopeptidase, partial [Gemmatimonadales bacterium]|nr:M1 family metallopeptidase [Gemmatimonadales bacterium]
MTNSLSMLLLALIAGLAGQAAGQAPQASSPVAGDSSPFRRLELPAANSIRTGSGAPGPDYWQQKVDYVIRASLDTVAQKVTGDERITYTNHSPDTLRYLWLQLDQNLFNSKSRGSRLFAQNSRFGTRGAEGGVTLTRVTAPEAAARSGAATTQSVRLRYLVDGTMMRVDLPRPLPPKARQVIEVGWSFPFGPNSNRMGLELIDDSNVYEVAQWYPRLAVYDDVRGWNTEQYLGQGEFYLEYGRFDVSLRVPANMLVAATGTLQNPTEVLTATQRSRLSRARASDSTVVIRGKDEIDDPASRPSPPSGMLTWRFTADSVRDFAWAAARHFVWDAARTNGGKTLAMSFYPPSAEPMWKESTQYIRFAVENYSSWYPYPYPVAINVNGIEGGMEYPMIVFCHNRTEGPALFSVTDHEIGHTWFPMVVGNNERLYAWMDEGLNTFMNYYNWEKKYPGAYNRRGNPGLYIPFAISGREEPIMTPADRIFGNLSVTAYTKPGLGLILLRDRIVGKERFDPAFREYIRRWAYKHPTPADFFRTIEDGVGEDLSWFWRSWFYTTEQLDQAVDSVRVADSAGVVTSRVYLRSAGAMPMPVELDLRLEDGTAQHLSLPVEIWYRGTQYTLLVPGPKRVAGASIDARNVYPDVRRENNAWVAPPSGRTSGQGGT